MKPAGSNSATKGQAYWVTPKGKYWLNTRPGIPKEIKGLLASGMSMREVSRPPGTFADDRGWMEPSALPARWSDPVPEPDGPPEGRAED